MTDTVEGIMALADEYAKTPQQMTYTPTGYAPKEARAALRAAVEQIVRDGRDLAIDLWAMQERAERAEAELENVSCNAVQNTLEWRNELNSIRAERDALLAAKGPYVAFDTYNAEYHRAERAEAAYAEVTKYCNEREGILAERDALRALLVEARKIINDSVIHDVFMLDTEKQAASLLASIDAATKDQP